MAGGGVRGIIQAKFLELLEDELKTSTFDLFDFFVGVSIGGIHACMIAADEMFCAEKLLSFYSRKTLKRIFASSWFAKGIFSPKYSKSEKYAVMEEVFQDRRLCDVKKPVMTYAYDYIHACPRFFSSYSKKKLILETYLKDITDATSAAPTYFPPTFISSHKAFLLDGGLMTTNPTTYALIEARKQGHRIDEIKILSLGTGLPHQESLTFGKQSKSWGFFQWFKKGDFIGKLFTAPDTAAVHTTERLLNGHFMHVPFDFSTREYSLDDIAPKTLKDLIDAAKRQFDVQGEDVLNFIRNENILKDQEEKIVSREENAALSK